MKLSTFIMMLLFVSAFFFTFAMMTQEADTYYPDADINDSEWANKYDFGESINETVAPLQQAFEDIQDENKGWFSKIISGIAAIPSAVIQIPVLVFKSFVLAGTLITGTMTSLGIPIYLIGIVLISVLVWGIFKLIELYQRWQI